VTPTRLRRPHFLILSQELVHPLLCPPACVFPTSDYQHAGRRRSWAVLPGQVAVIRRYTRPWSPRRPACSRIRDTLTRCALSWGRTSDALLHNGAQLIPPRSDPGPRPDFPPSGTAARAGARQGRLRLRLPFPVVVAVARRPQPRWNDADEPSARASLRRP